MACTEPYAGKAYLLNVCKPYVVRGTPHYRLVTAAQSLNSTSVVYYKVQYYEDSACTVFSDSLNHIIDGSSYTMTGVTGTCQPSCKLIRSSSMAGITTSLKSVMPSSGQLIPAGYTAISSAGYLQQITYQDKACSNVASIFATQLNTCFAVGNGVFAMYTAGSQSSTNMYSLIFSLYTDSTCTQMIYFKYPGSSRYDQNSYLGASTCTEVTSGFIGSSQRILLSTTLPSLPSTGAIIR
jgi:hypothetical protein